MRSLIASLCHSAHFFGYQQGLRICQRKILRERNEFDSEVFAGSENPIERWGKIYPVWSNLITRGRALIEWKHL